MERISQVNDDKLLGRKEIMQLFGINAFKTYYKYMSKSKIKAVKIGGVYKFRKSDIMEYLESKRTALI